jgi:hypothetical protein
VKKRASKTGYAEGQKSSCKVLLEHGFRSTKDISTKAAFARERRFRWRRRAREENTSFFEKRRGGVERLKTLWFRENQERKGRK